MELGRVFRLQHVLINETHVELILSLDVVGENQLKDAEKDRVVDEAVTTNANEVAELDLLLDVRHEVVLVSNNIGVDRFLLGVVVGPHKVDGMMLINVLPSLRGVDGIVIKEQEVVLEKHVKRLLGGIRVLGLDRKLGNGLLHSEISTLACSTRVVVEKDEVEADLGEHVAKDLLEVAGLELGVVDDEHLVPVSQLVQSKRRDRVVDQRLALNQVERLGEDALEAGASPAA